MISAIVSFGMVILLFFSGRIYESVKRLLILFTDIFLKIFNIFGIKLNRTERRIRVSNKFKEVFKDIRIVKQSKENVKIKPSINIPALILLIISICIVIINLNAVSGNIISKWLFTHNILPWFIKSKESMDNTLTAILFSMIAFSLSKLVNQWKETAHFRKAKKEMRAREAILSKMTAKELLDAAKLKDDTKYSELLKTEDSENVNNKDTKYNAKNF